MEELRHLLRQIHKHNIFKLGTVATVAQLKEVKGLVEKALKMSLKVKEKRLKTKKIKEE